MIHYRVYDPRKGKYVGNFDSMFAAKRACIESAGKFNYWLNEDKPFIVSRDGRVFIPVVNVKEGTVEFCETHIDGFSLESCFEEQEISGKVAFWKSKFL